MAETIIGAWQVGLSSALVFWGLNLKIMVCVCVIVCSFFVCTLSWPSLTPC